MVNAEAEFGNRGRLFFIRIEDICSFLIIAKKELKIPITKTAYENILLGIMNTVMLPFF